MYRRQEGGEEGGVGYRRQRWEGGRCIADGGEVRAVVAVGGRPATATGHSWKRGEDKDRKLKKVKILTFPINPPETKTQS